MTNTNGHLVPCTKCKTMTFPPLYPEISPLCSECWRLGLDLDVISDDEDPNGDESFDGPNDYERAEMHAAEKAMK